MFNLIEMVIGMIVNGDCLIMELGFVCVDSCRRLQTITSTRTDHYLKKSK